MTTISNYRAQNNMANNSTTFGTTRIYSAAARPHNIVGEEEIKFLKEAHDLLKRGKLAPQAPAAGDLFLVKGKTPIQNQSILTTIGTDADNYIGIESINGRVSGFVTEDENNSELLGAIREQIAERKAVVPERKFSIFA